MKKRIGIVFGGRSVEHDISILSALQVINAINRSKYDVIEIYLDRNNNFFVGRNFDSLDTFKTNFKRKEVLFVKEDYNQVRLRSKRGYLPRKYRKPLDCIINVVHGSDIEGGSLAGFFNLLDVPYTSANVLAASIGQDKIMMKKVFDSFAIKQVPYLYFSETDWIYKSLSVIEQVATLSYPVYIKPALLGSSIGISRVDNPNELQNALELAFLYDNKVVVEKALTNFREFNCSILGRSNEFTHSEIEEVLIDNDFFSFEKKYTNKKTTIPERIIPAEIDSSLKLEIQNISKQIGEILNNKGVSRIDYLYCEQEDILFVNEINTIPGSLSFYLFEGLGLEFPHLIDELITIAIKDKYLEKLKVSAFASNVLTDNNLAKGKGVK